MSNNISISEDEARIPLENGEVIDVMEYAAKTPDMHHSSIRYRQPSPYERRRSIKADFSKNFVTPSFRTQAQKELLNFAYHSIVNSRDKEIDRIERSNFFDEWKDTLNTIILKIDNLSANHRKIIGALIAATNKKDISDFNNDGLKLFENATFTLKQFRVSKSDSKRVIKKLLDRKMEIIIPLGFESNNNAYSTLEKEIQTLIKRFPK